MSNTKETVETVLRRVDEARSISGDLALVGFGVRGIQKMILSSPRLAAIRGASNIVKGLADIAVSDAALIFSAGGHGLFLAPAAKAKAVEERVVNALLERLPIGDISTTQVAFDRQHQKQSLQWLLTTQEVSKESATRRTYELPGVDDACPDCKARRRELAANGRKGLSEQCSVCRILEEADPLKDPDAPPDQVRNRRLDTLQQGGRLAMISADGNRVGDRFRQCETLEEVALLSAAVAAIFEEGVVRATGDSPEMALRMLAGGDDARLFLGPLHVPPFIGRFTSSFESACQDWAAKLDEMRKAYPGRVGEHVGNAVRELGAGIGVVVADYKFPVRRFAELSQLMEQRAKAYRPGRQAHSERFAVDIAFLTTGDELSQGADAAQTAMSISDRGRPGVRSWQRTWAWAQALATVPTSQTAQALEARRDGSTFMNVLGYQVARAREWQDYYKSIGLDWRDPYELKYGAPSRFLFELSRLASRSGNRGWRS